jgi:protoporphyrinogen oxidase
MKIVVIGAGPGGLAAAWNLVKDGHQVIVLERENNIGGAAATFERDGFRYDLGPHNLHPNRKSIIRFFDRTLGSRLHELKDPKIQVFFRGRRFKYPLTAQLFSVLPIFTTLLCVVSFLWQRILHFAGYTKDDGSYKTWVTNRFGRKFYDIFFGPYTEKTWGFPASQLSDIVAIKRIPVKQLSDLIKSLLFKTNPHDPKHSQTHSKMVNVYPKTGVGEVSEFFASELTAHGGEIIKGCLVDRIDVAGNYVTGVSYTQQGQPRYIDFKTDGGPEQWTVISTAAINDLILMMNGDVPEPVVSSAKGLDYSSMVFLYLKVNKPDIFGNHLLYFSDKEFPFNRVYDIGLFSRDMVPEGKNAICLEFSCTLGDATWNASPETIYEMAIAPLEKHDLLKRSEILGYHTHRLKNAYPRFRKDYQVKLRTIIDYVEQVVNLETFGRQGLFSYSNVDDVVWMAFQITEHLRYRDRFPLPMEEIIPEYIDF